MCLLALVRDEYWLKLAGREGSRERWESRGKEQGEMEEQGKRERESALQVWEGVELLTVVKWCVSGAKDLRFIRREFHKRGEELRNDRSANLSLVETGGRVRHR